MAKLYACIICSDAKRDRDALLEVARDFGPDIEQLEDGVLFDISGLEKLMGTADDIAGKIRSRMNEAELPDANAAVAETAAGAMLLARRGCSGHVSDDEFAQLPLFGLELEADMLGIFAELGVRTIRDLRQIPAAELIGRYGRDLQGVIDTIEGKSRRPVAANVREESLTWRYDLDFPVEDFERLIFIVNHGLDKLFSQTAYAGSSTEQLDLTLGLRDRTERVYEIKVSFPTLDRAFWLKIVNLRIALDPPESEIMSVKVVCYFTRPRPDQRGLYSVSRPDPESLLLTVNKLKKLVGEDNVGVPVILDERTPEAFELNADGLPVGRERLEVRTPELRAAFKFFRPPLPARVSVEDKRLVFIRTSMFAGQVKSYSGVWKEGSMWWNRPWTRHEWDVEMASGGVYRLSRSGNDWSMIGEYD